MVLRWPSLARHRQLLTRQNERSDRDLTSRQTEEAMSSNIRESRHRCSSFGLVLLFFICAEVLQPALANGAGKKTQDANQLQHFYENNWAWSGANGCRLTTVGRPKN
jgi:hypothetical protein